MSALRYSGEIRIRVTWIEDTSGPHVATHGKYRCFLRGPSGMATTVIVNAPAYLSHAVDSPEAFDDATRAALSFADRDAEASKRAGEDWTHNSWGDYAASGVGGSGWHVGRVPSRAWPKVETKDAHDWGADRGPDGEVGK